MAYNVPTGVLPGSSFIKKTPTISPYQQMVYKPPSIPGGTAPSLNLNTGFNTGTTNNVVAAGATGSKAGMPGFEFDISGIWETAGQMADAEINPQLANIEQELINAGYSAEESQRAINEAYPLARRSLQKSIYENMTAGEGSLAAAGTGRGGGRQELTARAGEREATGLEGIETQKQRETGAINRALTQYKGQLGTQKTNLIGQRGNLQATYAEQIRGNRFNEAATQYGFDVQAAQLAEEARQFNASLATTGTPQGLATTGTPQSALNYFITDADLTALGLNKKPKVSGNAGAVSNYPYYRPQGSYYGK